jgi:hypothetical protein
MLPLMFCALLAVETPQPIESKFLDELSDFKATYTIAIENSGEYMELEVCPDEGDLVLGDDDTDLYITGERIYMIPVYDYTVLP